jgi:hypothetical protein
VVFEPGRYAGYRKNEERRSKGRRFVARLFSLSSLYEDDGDAGERPRRDFAKECLASVVTDPDGAFSPPIVTGRSEEPAECPVPRPAVPFRNAKVDAGEIGRRAARGS